MAAARKGKIYVLFDSKHGWLSSKGMEPPLPKSWKAWPQCGISRDQAYPKHDMFYGPLDGRAKARAGIEKHLASLLKRGKLVRYKIRFTAPWTSNSKRPA